MATDPDNNLLTLLATKQKAAPPASDEGANADDRLKQLLSRINQQLATGSASDSAVASAPPAVVRLTPSSESGGQAPAASAPPAVDPVTGQLSEFIPQEPESIRAAGLTDSEVEALILKYLLARGDATGRDIADQVKLPFIMLADLLRALKQDQLLVYKGSAPMNDYVCQLTDLGRERARRYTEYCTYFGSAPVALSEYIEAVKIQSLTSQQPSEDDLRLAFADLLINPSMLGRLGPAINSGRGMFLYGFAGNGKTSIAERVTRAFGQYIWIPRCIGIDGEVIRLFDPVNHEEVPLPVTTGLLDQSRIDRRWVRVRRPTIVVGGELTMDNLEVTLNKSTGISEAPLQLKSNCGTLVIDDFGRQKMSVDSLLNRWIVPLEKRYDFLNLPNGKKIQVPFDQLIVFSTNLEPKDLVDDAFLRRIPYKIEVPNPSEEEFRQLLKIMCPKMGFEYNESAVNHLIDKHYKAVGRPFRCCQPRDLLLQIRNWRLFQKKPMELSEEGFDYAVGNYFTIM